MRERKSVALIVVAELRQEVHTAMPFTYRQLAGWDDSCPIFYTNNPVDNVDDLLRVQIRVGVLTVEEDREDVSV